MLSVWNFPALAQSGLEIVQPVETRAMALSAEGFHCHTGYSLAQCQKDIARLKSVLTRYPIEQLGHWTWVLVPSQDWKLISRSLGLNPVSPAFTALEPRETFLEEALFVHDPERTAELMKQWQRSMPALLELAVSHELGHAFCRASNEAAANRFGEELRRGILPGCRFFQETRKKNVAAGDPDRVRPKALRVP